MLLLYLCHWDTTARALMWLGSTGMNLHGACCPSIPNLIGRYNRITLNFYCQPVLRFLSSHFPRPGGSAKKIVIFSFFPLRGGLMAQSSVKEMRGIQATNHTRVRSWQTQTWEKNRRLYFAFQRGTSSCWTRAVLKCLSHTLSLFVCV